MATFRGVTGEAIIALLVIIICAWNNLSNGGQEILPIASAQQLLQDSMPLGSSWTAQSLAYMASPAKTFCFGWLRYPSTSLNFYVAVWYAGLDGSVVWAGNRNNPAAANDSLQLTSDGNLLLRSASNTVWQTNTASKPVSSLQILDSGNVVLVYKNGSYSWQSFSFPTDTLLPSQSFLVNSTIISRPPALPSSLASGNFKFYINGNSLAAIDYIVASSGESVASIWQAASAVYVEVDAVNSSSIAAQFLTNGVFCMYNRGNGSAFSQLVPSDYGNTGSNSVFRRLTLDADGQLRMYGWDYVLGSWIVLSEAIWAFCAYLSMALVPACGPYGLCVDAPQPACTCPPGFHSTDIYDVTSGCSPNDFPLPTCQNNQSSINSSMAAYLMLPNTEYYGNDILFKLAISLADCQSLCSQMCSCMGVLYDVVQSGSCWLKSYLSNGYSPQRETGSRDAYIKLQNSTLVAAISPPAQNPTLTWITSSTFWSRASPLLNVSTNCPSTCSPSLSSSLEENSHRYITKRASHMLIAVISLSELLCFIVGALIILWKANYLCSRHGQKVLQPQHAVCRAFTYAELVDATDHFRYRLGSGAFGVVFKGVLPEGTQIAVKRLQTGTSQIADAQFRAEIATLGRIHHMNLLRLYGFCAEGPDHRLLVYELMENGSLNRALFEEGRGNQQGAEANNDHQRRCLSWKTRYNICLGTARGLAYLHEDCLDCIVHCDIKPENILLDREFCPRVADFGLAYLFGRNETVQVSNVRGTRGYLAPEWVSYRPITAKADVFSYGMVLIEIVTGRRNFRFTPSSIANDRWNHPKWAFRQVQIGRLENVMDRAIRAQVMEDVAALREVERVLAVAFLCLHGEAAGRPSMKSVVQMLEGSIPVPPLPEGPGSFQEHAALDDDDAQPPQLGPLFSDAASSVSGSMHIVSGR